MGVSTDAILFYGYCWDEEGAPPWRKEDEDPPENQGDSDDDMDDPENRYAVAVGIERPKMEWSEEPAVKSAYSKYWDKKRKAVKDSGCETLTHCSAECPMYYVAVTESRVVASRGFPEKIKDLATKPEWDMQLRDYCKKMGIDIKDQRPRWWLVSSWG